MLGYTSLLQHVRGYPSAIASRLEHSSAEAGTHKTGVRVGFSPPSRAIQLPGTLG